MDRPGMPQPRDIEDALGRIETGIRQLKVQYDMYFSGALKRPPYEVRKEIEIQIKTMGNLRMQRFADRFRYNTLATKYQTMCELWSKMMRAKEEGRLRPGIPGFVEPVGRLTAKTSAERKAETERTTVAPPKARAPAGKPANVYYSISLSDPDDGSEPVKALYDRFLEANRENGLEAAGRISYNRFAKQIAAKTQNIMKKSGCVAVTYSIVLKDKGVTLKAVPIKGEGAKR